MKKRWLVLLALLAFACTLLLHVPAALLYAWVSDEQHPGPVRLQGLRGTLASGGFSALTVNNRLALTDGHWTLRVASLVLLRLSVEFGTGGDTVVRAHVSRGLLGPLRLSDVNVAGSVRALLTVLGQPLLPMEGQARINLQSLLLDGDRPLEAEGSAEVQNLAWTLAREPLPLGNFSTTLATDDKGVLAKLASGPGPLELSGEARLARDRAYDLRLQLRPRPQAPAQVLALVRSLGPPDAQGWYHIRRQGTL